MLLMAQIHHGKHLFLWPHILLLKDVLWILVARESERVWLVETKHTTY